MLLLVAHGQSIGLHVGSVHVPEVNSPSGSVCGINDGSRGALTLLVSPMTCLFEPRTRGLQLMGRR